MTVRMASIIPLALIVFLAGCASTVSHDYPSPVVPWPAPPETRTIRVGGHFNATLERSILYSDQAIPPYPATSGTTNAPTIVGFVASHSSDRAARRRLRAVCEGLQEAATPHSGSVAPSTRLLYWYDRRPSADARPWQGGGCLDLSNNFHTDRSWAEYTNRAGNRSSVNLHKRGPFLVFQDRSVDRWFSIDFSALRTTDIREGVEALRPFILANTDQWENRSISAEARHFDLIRAFVNWAESIGALFENSHGEA
ncbi:hypothetical protein [Maricaulis sp.]|uniref:hypothetical protein n=1 Tax=Maricaulis sp. TaxID=1486257 RepID=UPI003A90EBB0